ncbi:protein disulfide oxidoreductase [Sulfurovum sp.]|jgi:thiol-disulfide isomerase/thioredoxin|uniref:protein disulfide oxidoreductase n=1 Tax=Sulfurovum sp. TaxID=1969726 RepID=UPI002A36AF1C|nr:protein disulfide oxidoreductase [Sulfurovum sp.]MDD2451773.1 protein disulfide oxidoreductase [Sulfurovum sp.]MDD3500259.1 protein disulfide oxidoreductase [Sulfurovum sp.]MDY0401954.1 protein disulfide oxidoreductase [Sulfurovum sp.]
MKLNIKKLLKEILLFVVMLFVVSNILSYLRSPELQNSSLPGIEATLIDGSAFNSREAEGKPLVVHFWATWCPVCKAEASNIQALSEEYEVLSIAVNSGSEDALRRYMQQNGYRFRVLNDAEGQWAGRFNVEVFPTTFIFDGKGELKFTEVGYTTTLGLKGRLGVLK